MKRSFILEGDKTTAGGVVQEGCEGHTFNGRKTSFHGAKIACPACHSTGTLQCVAPRRPFTLPNGQEVALEDDLCVCKCQTPPKLVASQTFAGMLFNDAEVAAWTAQLTRHARATDVLAAKNFDLHFLITDDKSGRPLAGIPYRITLPTGEQTTGTTDQDGLTKTIGANAPVIAKLEAPYYGDSTSNTHTDDEHGACSC